MSRAALACVFVLATGGLTSPGSPANAAEPATPYKVGVARVEITPDHPIRLNGFGGRRAESEGAYQKIWAKALAIEDGTNSPAVLLAVDVLGIPADLYDELARRLEKKAGLKRERLAVTATHTHTGPMLSGANPTIFGVPIPKEHQANIDKYTRRASNAGRAVARGDGTLAIVFVYTGENEVVDGFPVRLIAPCEGLPYDLLSMSIVAKARNPDSARAFYEWALTPESLEIGYTFTYWQMPAHRDANIAAHVLNTDQAKLIDSDPARFGTAERRRLFDRWDREVSVLPR